MESEPRVCSWSRSECRIDSEAGGKVGSWSRKKLKSGIGMKKIPSYLDLIRNATTFLIHKLVLYVSNAVYTLVSEIFIQTMNFPAKLESELN